MKQFPERKMEKIEKRSIKSGNRVEDEKTGQNYYL